MQVLHCHRRLSASAPLLHRALRPSLSLLVLRIALPPIGGRTFRVGGSLRSLPELVLVALVLAESTGSSEDLAADWTAMRWLSVFHFKIDYKLMRLSPLAQ